MTLGRCPLSIFCFRGTPPREAITKCNTARTGLVLTISVRRGVFDAVSVGDMGALTALYAFIHVTFFAVSNPSSL